MVYDLNHQAFFHLIESLLYRSRYYYTSAQSIVMSCIKQSRPSVHAEPPRLIRGDEVHLEVLFASEALDQLFRMKRQPQSLAYIQDALGVDPANEIFSAFFTHQAHAVMTATAARTSGGVISATLAF